MNKYYKVIAVGGHKCPHKSGELVFYVEAENAYHAMRIAQTMPAVKHTCIPLSVKEIDKKAFVEGRKKNAYAGYFKEETIR